MAEVGITASEQLAAGSDVRQRGWSWLSDA